MLSTDLAPTAAGEDWDTAVKQRLRLLLASWRRYECMLPTLVCGNSLQSNKLTSVRHQNLQHDTTESTERLPVRHGQPTSDLTGDACA